MPSPSFFAPPPEARLASLPDAVWRKTISGLAGPLEVLWVEPPTNNEDRKTPIFFAHGGCGSAAVWIDWMMYLSQEHRIPCYAVSYRGHGDSWYPGYLRMYFTSARTLAEDLATAWNYIEVEETLRLLTPGNMVLVAHSNGGGLAQMALDAGLFHRKPVGLALIAATPCYGS